MKRRSSLAKIKVCRKYYSLNTQSFSTSAKWLIWFLEIQKRKLREITNMKMNVLKLSRFKASQNFPGSVSCLIFRKFFISSSSRELFGLSFETRHKCIDYNTRQIFSKYLHPHSLWYPPRPLLFSLIYRET